MPSLRASTAAAAELLEAAALLPAAVLEPPEELDELELLPAAELLLGGLVLVAPPPVCVWVAAELVLWEVGSAEPPPQAVRLRHAAKSAARSSRNRGFGMDPPDSLLETMYS
ncbi:MAG TPA: hypothetical protein VGL28_13305 [Steroidobacteraceae bacterium]|jgi:hypothetical protein